MFKVILLNDDYTPQEFVVHVLMRFFYMDVEKAWRLMWTVHTTGSAVIGIYPREIAETKSETGERLCSGKQPSVEVGG